MRDMRDDDVSGAISLYRIMPQISSRVHETLLLICFTLRQLPQHSLSASMETPPDVSTVSVQ